jgi:hypothetical protein
MITSKSGLFPSISFTTGNPCDKSTRADTFHSYSGFIIISQFSQFMFPISLLSLEYNPISSQ